MAGAPLLHHQREPDPGGLERHVPKGLEGPRKQKDIGGGVGDGEVVAGEPPEVGGMGEVGHVVFVGARADHEGAEGVAVLVETADDVGENVRAFFDHQAPDEEDDDFGRTEAVGWGEFFEVDAPPPYLYVGTSGEGKRAGEGVIRNDRAPIRVYLTDLSSLSPVMSLFLI